MSLFNALERTESIVYRDEKGISALCRYFLYLAQTTWKEGLELGETIR